MSSAKINFEQTHQLEQIFAEEGTLARTLPYFNARPEQLEMAQAVTQTINNVDSAILEAGLQALADATWCTNCNLPGLPEAACVGRCPR